MKYEEAVKTICGMFPGADVISFRFQQDVFTSGRSDIGISALVVVGGRNTEVFSSTTWQGVINKIRIHQEPTGTPTPEEIPQEKEVKSG